MATQMTSTQQEFNDDAHDITDYVYQNKDRSQYQDIHVDNDSALVFNMTKGLQQAFHEMKFSIKM